MSNTASPSSKVRFSIDRGGTFTDIYAEVPGEPGFRVMKLLSVDPANYSDAPREGIRRILEEVSGEQIPKSAPVPTHNIEWIRMGTTVATNALLERQGARTVLVTTAGLGDALQIGHQARPAIFDLRVAKPELLYESVIEVQERVRVLPAQAGIEPEGQASTPVKGTVHVGTTGEKIEVLTELDLDAVRAQLTTAKEAGIKSVAIVLMHSYTFAAHEEAVAKIAVELGFEQVTTSSGLTPMVRFVSRGLTTAVDAYLTPLIRTYVASFSAGFQDNLKTVRVLFMQSDGGLTDVSAFQGSRAIMSGPAGGLVGFARTTFNPETRQPVIGFDMGGTSTDVSRFDGSFEHVFETEIAGATIQAPQLDISTVAAGGGSRLFFRSGLFVVGPESASAHPGPVCYRKGGYLAVTDANLLLGRIQPDHFPKIFGPGENEPLSLAATQQAFDELTVQVNEFRASKAAQDGVDAPAPLSSDEVAAGFIRVANEAMARPIRNITEARGYDAAKHVLACFGGAGPQHACAIARSLGMKSVFVHRFGGILSAFGLGLADVVEEAQEPAIAKYGDTTAMESVHAKIEALEKSVKDKLVAGGFSQSDIALQPFLNLRYEGTDTALMIAKPDDGDYLKAFLAAYAREYGFLMENRGLLVDDVRVRGVGSVAHTKAVAINPASGDKPAPLSVPKVYFDGFGRQDTPVYQLGSLGAGAVVEGPAIIIESTSTTVVEPECTATISSEGNISIAIGDQQAKPVGTELDAIQLSIFGHRFMSIAEQMGRTLQRTSVSTNIKERLDFSCALFGPDGGLVANAPHLPVHLGAMSEAVRYQIRTLGDDWKEGEVLVANHPSSGGSHLPDITVITPVWSEGRPVFYVASRGHHADIGGITPGSMPPFSKTIYDEGACIRSFKLVVGGVFQEEGITKLLTELPKDPLALPGAPPPAGTRALRDNLSDLKAQVSANHKGILLVQELIKQYSLDVVLAYMGHIQDNAALAVRDMLSALSKREGLEEVDTLYGEDAMDDGTPIKLALTIDRSKGTAHFGFSGTGPEVYGNVNAPKAVSMSAILYALRSLVVRDIPLNEGCLKPISVTIPQGSLLLPSDTAAVVGGNVLTSQRVTDVILRTFRAVADSQGCMNNFTFGTPSFGYYETIAGGAGAGPEWHGQSAVQVHMTNTRITDPEILERRYPVLLRQFAIRRGSGGVGKYRGGDGVIRELEFMSPMDMGILSERRTRAPQGLAGGGPGAMGRNVLVKADGRVVAFGGKNAAMVLPGDKFIIMTPGGGGYGPPEDGTPVPHEQLDEAGASWGGYFSAAGEKVR